VIVFLFLSESHVSTDIIQLTVGQLEPVSFALSDFKFGVLEVLESLIDNVFFYSIFNGLGDGLTEVHDDGVSV
jgi:hypothetical protein